MSQSKRLLILTAWVGAVVFLLIPGSEAQTASQPGARKVVAPKIWDSKQLATWATPIAGINATPNYYSEEEYYAAPVDNLRTYPVYHPDYEPRGYLEWIKKQGPRPMVEPEKLVTERDWIEAGRRVFDELDLPVFRTDDPRVFKLLRDREAMAKDGALMTKDGMLLALRWVVEKDGKLKVGVSECAACHMRLMPDGTVIRGAQGNVNFATEPFRAIFEVFGKEEEKRGVKLQHSEYGAYAVPWVKDDIHERFKTMSMEEIDEVDGFPLPGTFARFNGSPYFITKIPDLIGVKDRAYLDATGTHSNRGPEDIARYGALVAYADDGAIGTHKFLTEEERRLRFRFSDEALYALGKFIYSLEPPPNPNRFDATAERGKKVFEQQGCVACPTPPLYTNNKLIPVEGFTPPKDDPRTARLGVLKGFNIDTDPNLALKTRKGTGYYKVPSLGASGIARPLSTTVLWPRSKTGSTHVVCAMITCPPASRATASRCEPSKVTNSDSNSRRRTRQH